MKPKKLVKRLSLGKSTIANLGDTEKLAVKAGYWATEIYGDCTSWHPICFSKPEWKCPYTPLPICPPLTRDGCELTEVC